VWDLPIREPKTHSFRFSGNDMNLHEMSDPFAPGITALPTKYAFSFEPKHFLPEH
jgi:hypothetical protein